MLCKRITEQEASGHVPAEVSLLAGPIITRQPAAVHTVLDSLSSFLEAPAPIIRLSMLSLDGVVSGMGNQILNADSMWPRRTNWERRGEKRIPTG